jgi:hypothetical protein
MFIILPSPHPGALARPSTPKMLQAKKCAPMHYSFIIFTSNSHLSLFRNLGMCHPSWGFYTFAPKWCAIFCYNYILGNAKKPYVSTFFCVTTNLHLYCGQNSSGHFYIIMKTKIYMCNQRWNQKQPWPPIS